MRFLWSFETLQARLPKTTNQSTSLHLEQNKKQLFGCKKKKTMTPTKIIYIYINFPPTHLKIKHAMFFWKLSFPLSIEH